MLPFFGSIFILLCEEHLTFPAQLIVTARGFDVFLFYSQEVKPMGKANGGEGRGQEGRPAAEFMALSSCQLPRHLWGLRWGALQRGNR